MIIYVLFGALAAFGLLCLGWMSAGWALSGGSGGSVVCICRPDGGEHFFLRRILLMQELGLIRSPVILLDEEMSEQTRLLAEKGNCVRAADWNELKQKVELERERVE